jgi:hypothetical protein
MDYIEKEIPKNKIDKLLDKYYKSKSTAILDKLDNARKEQRKSLGRKLKQDEIDQLIREGITK